ncbi:phage tail protein [Providencia rustigianii]|uniref:phage tail protein n=1 Tax=Providencia rustigianii TaxID=158850 RepID=UPI000F707B05|nr:phage tail protein [Providencia rustigianii]MTC61015.1 phage tail protein [Providencia rustigianii]VEH55430.1 P2 phage tail completion protein R (GpR) [Providencia rustigianii]
MLKPNLLREILVKFAPYFKQNPELLEVYVTSGNIQSTGTASVSYLTEYEINVFAMDFSGELDHLILAILTWAKKHQPDLLFNPDKRKSGIRFDADILDSEKIDVLFTIKATERVVIKIEDEKIIFDRPLEPNFPDRPLPDWDKLIEEGILTYA